MKHLRVVLAVAIAFLPITSFGDCPDEVPYVGGGSGTNFYFDTSCASTWGDVTTTTMWCYSSPSYQWDFGSGSVDYSMTVPAGEGGDHWSLWMYVTFDDSYWSSSNALSATMTIWHNGHPTANNFFYHDGSYGPMSCELVDIGYFSVAAGDTIELSIEGTNRFGALMQVTTPVIGWD